MIDQGMGTDHGASLEAEARNPKLEIRNKFKTQSMNDRNGNASPGPF
jgi:hypothetical protein